MPRYAALFHFLADQQCNLSPSHDIALAESLNSPQPLRLLGIQYKPACVTKAVSAFYSSSLETYNTAWHEDEELKLILCMGT